MEKLATPAQFGHDPLAAVTAERDHLQRDNQALHQQVDTLGQRLATLENQLAWFERQLVGEKSERRMDPAPGQLCDS